MNFVSLHKRLEHNSGLLIFGILVVASIGGLVQIVPTLFQKSLATPIENLEPYPPLEPIGAPRVRARYHHTSCTAWRGGPC